MKQRKIGRDDVGEIGLGCMGMSWAYGPSDEQECIRVLDRSLDLGINFWDTADMYGAGDNEKLLSKSLAVNRGRVFLATKFGNVYDRSITSHQDQVAANVDWIVDGTPEYVKRTCDLSLQRLGVDHVDLYYQHRVDPLVPIEETVGAMSELVSAGKVRNLGLSEAAAATIRRAHAVHPIAAVQTEYSLWSRDVEKDILPACDELGITFVPYSPLGRGFLAGRFASESDLSADDARRNHPRFQGDNFLKNLDLVNQVQSVARKHQVTPAQVALAWVLSRGESLIPIPGTKQLRYLEENAAATQVELTSQDLAELEDLTAATGHRYPERAARFLNG